MWVAAAILYLILLLFFWSLCAINKMKKEYKLVAEYTGKVNEIINN